MTSPEKYANILKLSFIGICTTFVVNSTGFAQLPQDALRLGTPGLGVGARALGMGDAYTGVASDYSAIFWNPAGLAQINRNEFSLGLSYLNNRDNSTFFGNQVSYTNNATDLNALGIVYPVPVRRGSLVLAFGYQRQADFTTGVSFNGFNPNSSIIQTLAPNGQPYPANISLAEDLNVAIADTTTGKFFSPINGRLTQIGTAIEGKGLNNFSVAGGVEMSKNLYVGLTLTYLSGGYRYDRTYQEQDNLGVYSTPYAFHGDSVAFDLKDLTLQDYIDDDITGVNALFGLMYSIPDRFRLGITIKTPTSFTIKETYGTTGTSTFTTADKNGNYSYGPFSNPGSVEYDVHTPWVFGMGVSFIIRDLVLSGDVNYTDWTQLEFAGNAPPDLIATNNLFKTMFHGTANLRGGAEYEIRDYGVRLRAGFIYNPSPYEGAPSTYNQKYVTGGLGFLMGESAMIDLAYAHGWWQSARDNYDPSYGASVVGEDVATNNFIMTFSYRF